MFQRIVSWCGRQFQNLLGLLLPLATWKNVSTFARILWWIGFFVGNALILYGLYWLNDRFKMAPWLEKLPGWLRPFWMPTIWLIILALAWLSWLLWKLLVSEELDSDCPDIDAAWAAGVAALRRKGIALDDVPLFLVLGKPRGDDTNLFRAGGLELAVPGVPDASAPVRVFCGVYYVKKEAVKAIFVTCPDASVLATQAAFLARQQRPGPDDEESVNEDWETASIAPDGTMVPGKGGAVQQYMEVIAEGEGSIYSPVQQAKLAQMERASKRLSLASNDIERQVFRLRHLCRLIARDRYPVCPTNGILVLIPFAGTDTEQDAGDTGEACKRDLETARKALGVHCPVLSVLCDMEAAPGFSQFIGQFRAVDLRRRMGQRFPYVPSFSTSSDTRTRSAGSAMRERLRSLASWLGRGFLRRWIYQHCQLEQANGPPLAEILQTNKWLILLLTEMQNRQGHLGKILEIGFSSYAPLEWLLYGGCYFAATGERDEHRAFMAGVLDRLLEDSALVYWSDEVRAEDARIERWITWGWLILGGVVVAALGGLIFLRMGR